MGWSYCRIINVRPAGVSFSGSGSGGVKGAGASVGPGARPAHGGKLAAVGCGCFSFLIFGVLFFICFAVFSRLEPRPVAERPPMEAAAERQQPAEPKPIQPAIEEAEAKPLEPAIEPPMLPDPEPEAEPPTLPDFKIEPAPESDPEREAEPETEPLVRPQTAYRDWTNKTGEFQVEAEFVSMAMGKVKLRKADGEEVTLALEQLSATDQQWIEKEKASSSSAPTRLSRDSRILSGSVTGVADGDTITVSDRRKMEHQVRLQGIDAPEEGQAYSAPAKEALLERILGKSVRVEWRKKDGDGRILGHVFLGVRWINKELVEEGWAWHRKQSSDNEELADAETRASEKLLGLWAEANAIPPWEFKSSEPAKEDSPSGDFWLTSSSGVRHNNGCRYYKKSNGNPCGPNAGTACKVCGG
jgi:micrococcal nuclease